MYYVLLTYEQASGQAVNLNKSGVFFSANVNDQNRERLKGILGVSSALDTSRYLGLPSMVGRRKVETFQYVKEKLWAKLKGWRSKKLSKAGKEILMKAAAQSIPVYCMSTFLLPQTLVNELHRMMNAFWWGHGSDPKKGVKWETWEALCKSKREGGMGFRDLSIFNVAMLGKLVWKLLQNPNSLVARILRARYYASGDLLNAGRGRSPSYIWTSIYSAKHVVGRGLRWRLCKGDNIRIWDQPWLDCNDNFYIQTPKADDYGDSVVVELFIPGTKQWNRELLDIVFTKEDVGRIMRTTPSRKNSIDTIMWHFSDNGVYTVSSGYHMAINVVNESWNQAPNAWSKLWKIKIPPRIKACFWRICKGWVCVKSKLCKWNPGMDNACSLCAGGNETMWHLFIECAFARDCWRVVGLWNTLESLLNEVDGLTELVLRLVDELPPAKLEAFAMTLWQVWRCRNNKVWQDEEMPAWRAIQLGTAFVADWKAVRNRQEGPRVQRCRRWHAPAEGRVKFNSDASFFDDSLSMGIGLVVRNDRGDVLHYRTLLWPGLMRVEEGEAFAVLEAMKWAQELGFMDVEFEFDAQKIETALNKEDPFFTTFGDYISLIKDRKEFFHSTLFRWVNRDANSLAHSLSRNARFFESPSNWVEPPIDVDGLLGVCVELH
ncbi:hypothetical protein OROMI_012546 [Orobanche minor]